jgi:hypothetical protein
LRAVIVNNLKERFKTIEADEIFQLSTYLDPRFKSAGFSKDEHASNAIIALKEQLKTLQDVPTVDTNTKLLNSRRIRYLLKKIRISLISTWS